jgi:hypothetical protein
MSETSDDRMDSVHDVIREETSRGRKQPKKALSIERERTIRHIARLLAEPNCDRETFLQAIRDFGLTDESPEYRQLLALWRKRSTGTRNSAMSGANAPILLIGWKASQVRCYDSGKFRSEFPRGDFLLGRLGFSLRQDTLQRNMPNLSVRTTKNNKTAVRRCSVPKGFAGPGMTRGAIRNLGMESRNSSELIRRHWNSSVSLPFVVRSCRASRDQLSEVAQN